MMRLCFFLCILTVGLTSCEKEPFDHELMVGEWRILEMSSENGVRKILFYGAVSDVPIEVDFQNIDVDAVFSGGPDEFSLTGSYTRVITAKPKAGDPALITTDVAANENGMWDIDVDELELGSNLFKILALDQNQMILQMQFDGSWVQLSPGLIGYSDHATVTWTLERQ